MCLVQLRLMHLQVTLPVRNNKLWGSSLESPVGFPQSSVPVVPSSPSDSRLTELTSLWWHMGSSTTVVSPSPGAAFPLPPLSRGAVNPQCHLSPLLTFLSEAHYSHDTFWQSLKILLLISLPLKDDRDELLGKTWNLCSTWVLNQRNSKEGKDNKPIYYNIVPKPSKKVISVS